MKTWLMKPYSLRGKGKPFQIANYRISRGRRVVENTFGILSSRFRVLSNTILVHPRMDIVLHNMLRAERGARAASDLDDEDIPCGMDDGSDGDGHDRNPANSAKEQRDYLKY